MYPPSRARRILKWTGVGMSLLIAIAWATSTYISVSSMPLPYFHFELLHGGIEIDAAGFNLAGEITIWPAVIKSADSRWRGLGATGFRAPKFKVEASWATKQPIYHALIPFWLLFFLTAIPTASLWHRDRRRIRPGCCLRCGYDLTGNTSGVCSECGLPATPSHDASV